ncbi:Retrovirus-related Pol polyprotein like [Argiope bruennichi]|uniref:RNA-directed DNA polymerase n=1 Tax=Argiope bruennichi TaxID=94029 RepID=A0A8T0EY68_ARGBR|nr:Retrovirus-related Pol polyprotein like [Argiope bruennichi]
MADNGNGELLALLAEMKKSMEAGQEEMKKSMETAQKKTLERIEEEMKSGQKELKKDIASVKEEFSNIIQEKMNANEDKVASFENKKFGKEIENLVSHEHVESKMIFTPSLATIKLSTFDGKTSWQVYKTQFTMVAEANGWNPQAKALHLAASLRGDAADILKTLTEEQRHDFQALSSALELRFGEKCTKEYSRLQLKSRYQKAGESLQELAADIQRLSHLAFSDCPVETRQDLALQHFIDSVPCQSRSVGSFVGSEGFLSTSVIPVRVANISDKKKIIQKGEVLATCPPVTCIDRKCKSQDVSSDDLVQNLLQDTDLDEKQRCAARELIKEFQNLFSGTSEDFRRTQLVKHRIDAGEHPPIRKHSRRLPFAKQEDVQTLIKEMQDNDEANLKLSPSKCHLFRREVACLGHIISAEGVRTDPDKISAVRHWTCPTDVHQLRSFLGSCTYYRKFVKNFSTIARPLHKLTEAKQKFIWTDECDNAFNMLKDALTSTPVLAYPEIGKQFILDMDASHECIGAVLSQEVDGQERVIAYFSKCLSKQERNYCVTRKELLAIVKAVEVKALPLPLAIVKALPLRIPTVAEILVQNWISRYGVPLQLHSDQGRNFDSAVFRRLCEIHGIDKTRTTALHPQLNGMVERFNRTILNSLSLLVLRNQPDWDKKLPLFLLAYRSAVHETTGYSPSQMLFERDLRLPADLLFTRPPDAPLALEEYVETLRTRMEEVHHLARDRIGMASEKMKIGYDTGATGHNFHEGDQVCLWNPKRRKGLSPKLQTNWEGPYTVLKRLNDVVVRIQNHHTQNRR